LTRDKLIPYLSESDLTRIDSVDYGIPKQEPEFSFVRALIWFVSDAILSGVIAEHTLQPKSPLPAQGRSRVSQIELDGIGRPSGNAATKEVSIFGPDWTLQE
jgi:hypothetical protein